MYTTLHSRTPHTSLGGQTLSHKGPGRPLAGCKECSAQVKESLSAFRSPGPVLPSGSQRPSPLGILSRSGECEVGGAAEDTG